MKIPKFIRDFFDSHKILAGGADYIDGIKWIKEEDRWTAAVIRRIYTNPDFISYKRYKESIVARFGSLTEEEYFKLQLKGIEHDVLHRMYFESDLANDYEIYVI